MKKTLEDIFLMGVGAARLTTATVRKRLSALAKKGVIDRKEALQLGKRFLREAQKKKAELVKEGRKGIYAARKQVISGGKAALRKGSRALKEISRRAIRKAMKL